MTVFKKNEVFAYLKIFLSLIIPTLIFKLDLSLEISTQNFLSIFAFIIYLWLFSTLPLFASGIIGVCLSVIFGIVSVKEAFAPFASPVIFLFLGGFLIAKAMEVTELDKKVSEYILGSSWVSKSPKRCVFVFLLLSFTLSMWISNTAAVAMLLPLSYGVLKKLEENFNIVSEKFSEKFLLSLAFAATLGGNMTPIGSPPNIIALGLLSKVSGGELSFLRWGLYASLFTFPLFFILYKRCVSYMPKSNIQQRPEVQTEISDDARGGKFSFRQKYVFLVFTTAVILWTLPSLLGLILPKENIYLQFFSRNLSTPIVALLCGVLLFIVPFKAESKILSSHQIAQIDWGSLLLFGSGLSLGNILFKTGGADYIISSMQHVFGDTSPIVIILTLLVFTIFFTEVASNTASANIILPIVISFAQQYQLNSAMVAFLFALACNSAFMLPVATPPNTIVFGTQKVSKKEMMKFGGVLNLLAAVVLLVIVLLTK